MAKLPVVPPEVVRRVRRHLNETQAEFARRLRVAPVTVARWETGQRGCAGHFGEAVKALAPSLAVRPTQQDATVSALAQLAQTLFHGSTATAVSALLDHETLSDDDLDALAQLIAAKRKGRKKRSRTKRKEQR